jgi:hypothetical protein
MWEDIIKNLQLCLGKSDGTIVLKGNIVYAVKEVYNQR